MISSHLAEIFRVALERKVSCHTSLSGNSTADGPPTARVPARVKLALIYPPAVIHGPLFGPCPAGLDFCVPRHRGSPIDANLYGYFWYAFSVIRSLAGRTSSGACEPATPTPRSTIRHNSNC